MIRGTNLLGGNAHLLSGDHQSRFQSHMVRDDHLHYGDDRSGHSSGGDQRLRGQEYHQGAFWRDLQRGLSLPAQPCRLWGSALFLSADCYVPSGAVDEVDGKRLPDRRRLLLNSCGHNGNRSEGTTFRIIRGTFSPFACDSIPKNRTAS